MVDWRQLSADYKRLGIRDGDVHLAKQLVEYPPELEPAMNSVFGQTVICSSMEVAKKVAYESRNKVSTGGIGATLNARSL